MENLKIMFKMFGEPEMTLSVEDRVVTVKLTRAYEIPLFLKTFPGGRVSDVELIKVLGCVTDAALRQRISGVNKVICNELRRNRNILNHNELWECERYVSKENRNACVNCILSDLDKFVNIFDVEGNCYVESDMAESLYFEYMEAVKLKGPLLSGMEGMPWVWKARSRLDKALSAYKVVKRERKVVWKGPSEGSPLLVKSFGMAKKKISVVCWNMHEMLSDSEMLDTVLNRGVDVEILQLNPFSKSFEFINRATGGKSDVVNTKTSLNNIWKIIDRYKGRGEGIGKLSVYIYDEVPMTMTYFIDPEGDGGSSHGGVMMMFPYFPLSMGFGSPMVAVPWDDEPEVCGYYFKKFNELKAKCVENERLTASQISKIKSM